MTDPWLNNIKPVDAETEAWVLSAHRVEEAAKAARLAQQAADWAALIAKPNEEARQAKLREAREVSNSALEQGRKTLARNRRIRELHATQHLEPDLLAERFGLGRDAIYAILKLRPEAK